MLALANEGNVVCAGEGLCPEIEKEVGESVRKILALVEAKHKQQIEELLQHQFDERLFSITEKYASDIALCKKTTEQLEEQLHAMTNSHSSLLDRCTQLEEQVRAKDATIAQAEGSYEQLDREFQELQSKQLQQAEAYINPEDYEWALLRIAEQQEEIQRLRITDKENERLVAKLREQLTAAPSNECLQELEQLRQREREREQEQAELHSLLQDEKAPQAPVFKKILATPSRSSTPAKRPLITSPRTPSMAHLDHRLQGPKTAHRAPSGTPRKQK